MSMRTNVTKRLSLSVAALGPMVGLLAASAAAQETARQVQELETVVVTGSLLKRSVGDVAQPITTVSSEDLIRSGATNPERIMQQIAQNQSAQISNINLGAGTGGASYANLRALGSARTLVLVNGKRVVNNPYQSLGVDLNTIPTALIDRVEVLTDGGSATYGTDAIAGVMNFITAKDMQGLSMSATTMQPEASGGGQQYQASLAAGYGSLREDRWNINGGVTWRKQERLEASEREFTKISFIPEHGLDRLNPATFPANYTQPASGINSPVNPSYPQCAPPFSLPDTSFGPQACAYDQLARVPQVPPQEQSSVFVKGSVMLGEQTASLEYLRAQNEGTSFLSEQGVFALSLTAANPYYPGRGITPGDPRVNPALPVFFHIRTVEMGRRENTFEGFTDRAVGQLEGTLAGWDYQLSALISTSTTKVIFKDGLPDEGRIRDGFAGTNGAPFLNPFGPQSAAGQQFLNDIQVRGEAQRAEGDLIVYGAQVSRDLWQLPAGALALAAAVELKSERAKFMNNMAIVARVPSSFGSVNNISGDRDSKSLALEVNIPILQSLEVGVSGRYDHYEGFGSTVNPELSVRFQPVNMLTLRGSYSTGFRAPTLYDVFQPNTVGFTAQRYNDPVLCPGGVPNIAAGAVLARDCNTIHQRLVGGNRDLNAEESQALSVGFEIEPLPSLTFGVDYWEYQLEQTIAALPEQAVFGDPTKYADMFVRCSQLSPAEFATQSRCLQPPGDPLAYIVTTTQNLGDTRTSGFDATAGWSSDMTERGKLGLTYRGTYVSKYEFQREPGGPFFSRNGKYFDGSPVIRYAHFATLSWDLGDWGTRLTNRYKSGYHDCNCGIAPAFFQDVEANSLWDLSLSYAGLENLSLSLTVLNLLDEEPPFSNKNSGLTNAFDDRFADPLLRTYLLSATYKFW